MILKRISRAAILASTIVVAACAPTLATAPLDERMAIQTRLMRDIDTLASDQFGGRKPGTDGERATVNFIIEEFRKAGLESGTNDPGNAWRAPVGLISTQAVSGTIAIKTGRKTFEVPASSGAAFATSGQALVEDAQLVFVGREAESVPADAIAGQVVVMIGEPGVSPARRANLFTKGPAAIITVVEDAQSIAQQRRFRSQERLLLESDEDSSLTAYVTNAAMADALGEDYWNVLLASADDEDFEALDVTSTATIKTASNRREFVSYNVIGRLAGAKPDAGAVMLLGHWDHLGECGGADDEDRLCNGAIDNASGIAVMLELAKRLKTAGPFDRDIYFLATTAEESGLIGARAFAENPPVPLDTIVAAFNFDTVAIAPQGSPVGIIGKGRTPLDGMIEEVLSKSKRASAPDELAEQFIQRQDGWALLQKGVPTVMISSAFGSEETLNDYLSQRYHRSNDEIDGIELGGAIDDLLLHEELIRRTANVATYPANAK